jgi:hypothetical protein
MELTRRSCVTVLTAAIAANTSLIGKEDNAVKELLEANQNDKKGVTLYVKGQSIGGIVSRIAGCWRTAKPRVQQFSRIVVRIEAIAVT